MTDDDGSSGKPINFLEAARQLRAKKAAESSKSIPVARASGEPLFVPPRSSGTGGDTGYGLAALRGEYDKLRMLQSGSRNHELFKSACNLGELVAGGELTEATVHRELIRACEANQLISEDGLKTVESTIQSGFRKGMQSPRQASQNFEWQKYEPLAVVEKAPEQPPEQPPDNATSGLPSEFWEARPYLLHIRQAAWSRGRSAEAVLGASLARVAAGVTHQMKLPPVVGARCGLSLITALVGDPAAGKSSAAAIARQVIPPRDIPPECDGVPPGSGEGLIELLFGWETEVDPITNKGVKVKRQQRFNCYCYVDEGEILSQQGRNNQGTTFWTVMRSAFTDGVLGQSNANEERKRIVPSGNYVYGIVVAIQPLKAGPIFSDESGGTPQRVLWVDADTEVPEPNDRPDFPGKLRLPTFSNPKPDPLEPGYKIVEFPQEIRDEIVMNDHVRRIKKGNPLDSHTDLIQLKVAAILAIMDGRTSVTMEDWRLSRMVTNASKVTRDGIQKELGKERQQKILARGQAQAVVEGVVEEARGERFEKAMARVEKNILTRLGKHNVEHQDQTCSRKCLTPAVAGRDRSVIGNAEGVKEALERLAGRDLIEVVGQDRYRLR